MKNWINWTGTAPTPPWLGYSFPTLLLWMPSSVACAAATLFVLGPAQAPWPHLS